MLIEIFKWLFILFAIVLSVYHYVLERKKLNQISQQINDPRLLSELKASARTRMSHFLLLFSCFIIWSIAYDIKIQDVNKEKTELANELQKASKAYADASASQSRLLTPKSADQNVIDDVKSYYTDVFVNYYVMRKCNLAGPDDAFIINSAMDRELNLNNIPHNLRDDIIKNAKDSYIKKYSNVECSQLQGNYKDIINNYKNYISAVREVLRATF